MNTRLWLVFLLAGGLMLPVTVANAQISAPASQGSTAAKGTAQNGGELYLRYSCYACHGYAGHGGSGARLVPMRMSLPTFTAYVRNPGRMPPYTATVMSDAQLADVWAYIKTIPESPPARSIPLLSQMLNEK